MSNTTETEPRYASSVDSSGLRFVAPGDELRPNEAEVEAERVDPAIRAEGRAWLAARTA